MAIAVSIDIEFASLAQNHYENFPVASVLLPKKWRYPISLVYAYARIADDLADEGSDLPEIRLEKLSRMIDQIEAIDKKSMPLEPLFQALKPLIESQQLSAQYFINLALAFKQDVVKSRYQNFNEVLQYCQYSANPVGRLLLELTDNASSENLKLSDNICTALQLINFLQDISSDLIERDRCYLPLDDLQLLDLKPADILDAKTHLSFEPFIEQQWLRASALLQSGKPLGKRLTGLFGLEIRLIIASGEKVLALLKKRRNPLMRPLLKKWHYTGIFFKALFKY